jgi:hypothetical protein
MGSFDFPFLLAVWHSCMLYCDNLIFKISPALLKSALGFGDSYLYYWWVLPLHLLHLRNLGSLILTNSCHSNPKSWFLFKNNLKGLTYLMAIHPISIHPS